MATATPTTSSVLTVSQLTQAIKQQIEGSFPFVQVEGEISNFKRQASGHLYFSLKDSGAQISCVMFRGAAAKLKKLPKDGDSIQIKGELNVYAPRGNYQIVVKEMKLAGLGELLLKLEELKREIHRRGWFSQQHKKKLPPFPKAIGVVTSPTGAAIQDMLNVLTRRNKGFHLIINPVRVQGETAAGEIARAIDEFNHHNNVDVIIIGRGGGSIEDLWAFNEEIVATAIFNSKIPILTAVGHETDHCIAEYVADMRAPTPSAAAEIVLKEKLQLQDQLQHIAIRLKQTVQHRTRQYRQRLQGILHHPALRSAYSLLGPWIQKTDELRDRIDQIILQKLERIKLKLESFKKSHETSSPLQQIRNLQQQLKMLSQTSDNLIQQKIYTHSKCLDKEGKLSSIDHKIKHQIEQKREKLNTVINHLYSINPKNLLKKGYSILFSKKDGSAISSIQQLQDQKQIRILLQDCEASATIDTVTEKTEDLT